ncbi:MAG TPA: fused MFS/spermidine synthase [Candidatus Limnocylindrales bacterium]|nr:fused MFS/spermidine synthase [Candidatus Limnocylindrales bacterium]
MTARTIPLARPLFGATLPFALPIGLSAFLLFSVEPLIGRLVLPVFGGTPAVWATVLFFFQGVLLVGYLYGHVSVMRLGTLGPPLHMGLAGLAIVALLIAPARVADLRADSVLPVLDLIRILLVMVGLPALVLTTTTPLVSGWFEATRSRETDADGYWLYALSNGGSLLALVAYPFLIEPRLGLGTQRGIWAIGYALLVVLLAIAASRALPALRERAASFTPDLAIAAAAPVVDTRPVDWPRRGRWLLLAAVPSGLLSAVTNFIATDLVSAPLLWVAPLSIYLASFIVAFSPRGARVIGAAVVAAPAMITLLWVPYGSAGGWPVLAVLVLELAAFGVVAVALHGRLAQDRPDPSRLTEFYLTLSLGGALASAFVALIAPAVFPGVWELPILLIGALVGLALVTPRRAAAPSGRERGLDFSPFISGARARVGPYVVVAAALIAILVATHALATDAGIRWLLVGGLVLLVGARPWFLALATTFVLILATFVLQPPAEFRDRSFFGVTEVLRSPDGNLTLLMNGTTVHGSQSTDPARARHPQAYYTRNGPAGDLFAIVAPSSAERAVGIAGLGGGALASYAGPTTAMTFFEIDPVVIRVASDPRYFTYLSGAPSRPLVVEGDARLSFEDVPDGRFDLLVLDAFSSDSVPIHLLTAEAIADEIRITASDGLLAFHVSNRYYDLTPAIAAGVTRQGLTILEKFHSPGEMREPGETPSHWLAASRDRATLDRLRAAGWTPVTPAERPFTDDYADLLRYLDLGQ